MAPGDQEDLLGRVATALNSPLELKDVLRLLGDVTLEATGAGRYTVFLLEGDQLYPAVSIGRERSQAHWEAFRSMAPIDVDSSRAGPFLQGHPVVIEDAAVVDLIPQAWIDTFSLRAVVLIALRSGGTPCGLLTLDWSTPRSFTSDELRVIETLASYAGTAVGNAHPFEVVRRRARLQTALARGAAALASPLGPNEIIERLADGFVELLGARICAIALVDLERQVMTSVAARNAAHEVRCVPLADIPEALLSKLGAAWAVAKRPLEIADDPWLAELLGAERVGVSHYVVLPLLIEGHTNGGILLGFDPSTTLDAEERAAAEALAAIAAAALERHELLGRLSQQLSRLDALYHASTALAEGGDAADLVARVNHLLDTHGVEVVGVTFRDAKVARHLGGDRPTPEERATWRVNNGAIELPDGSLAVPMRLGKRVVGSLRVRPASVRQGQRSFLEALATGVAEVASRGALRAELEEAKRDHAIQTERERMAADLHDTAGQLFVALGLLAGRLEEQLDTGSQLAQQTRRIVELSARGKHQIDQAVLALSFLPAAQRGMAASVRALARSIASDSGLRVTVCVHGRAVRMSGQIEQALYRVAHEALTNAWRHAHGEKVQVDLTFADDHVLLRVVDDGVGLNGAPNGDGLHVGILGMRRVMADAGGLLRVACAKPRGTVVEAQVPREVA
jgi:signal transduction histidine kinase